MSRVKLPVAAHTFLLRSGSVLLLRRCNTGFEDGNYSLVGGYLEGSESVTQAAIRECREEVGVEIDRADMEVVGVTHYNSPTGEGIDFFLSATQWTGRPRNLEPDFCNELRWCRLDALPENTIPFVRRAAENLQAGVWFDELGWSRVRPLLHVVHLIIPDTGVLGRILVIQTGDWCGQLQPSDLPADAVEMILGAQFVPVEDAIHRLE